MLEELGLKYTVHKIDISKNVQKEPWFLDINRESSLFPLERDFVSAPEIVHH